MPEQQNEKSNIKNTIVVLSGKGGVGKSTISANLAVSLSKKGYKVGLLDVDIHGPSIPTLLNLENRQVIGDDKYMYPIEYNENLKVMSIGFMSPDATRPIIWRGPMKISYIQQMVTDVAWGEIDYLVVDCPPGTGDEPLSVIQTLQNIKGGVVVTTPQKLAIVDVKKSINFCKQLKMNILGVIENMSGFICPECKKHVDLLKFGGGEAMAEEMDIKFLGKIPIEIEVMKSGDSGAPFVESCPNSQSAEIMNEITDEIIK